MRPIPTLVLAMLTIAAAPAVWAQATSPAVEAQAEVVQDLNAAVAPPPANSDPDALAPVRAHEERAAEALDPDNAPAAPADGTAGCGPAGAGLACGTNLELRDRPANPAAGDQTPDRDLMGRPR